MSRRNPPVVYPVIPWGGQVMTPIQWVADSLISLLPPRYARQLHRSGAVTILSVGEWNEIQANKGSGLNVDPAYLRT